MGTQSFSKTIVIIIAVAALAVGLVAGYYFGDKKGFTKGKESGIAQEKKAQEDLIKKASGENVINPADYIPETNPLKDAKTNPYEGVYKNPFK